MGDPTGPLDLTLSDLEKSTSRPLRFRSLKKAELRHTLLLKNNRKTPLTSNGVIRFDPCDLERLYVRSPIFLTLVFQNGVLLGLVVSHAVRK